MRPMALMDLLNVLEKNGSEFVVSVEKKLKDLAVGDSVLERVGFVATLGELDTEGESEKAVRLENGRQSAVGKALPLGAVEKDAVGELIRGAIGTRVIFRSGSSKLECERVEAR